MKLLFRAFALCGVSDGGHEEKAFLGFQGAKTDLNRKLVSITVNGIEFQTRAHRP